MNTVTQETAGEEGGDQAGKKKKKAKNKKRRRLYITGGVLIVFILIYRWGTAPLQGTMHVGVCRTFAELQLEYPHTMKIMSTEIFERSQRLYYTFIDGFGHHNSNLIDCRFIYPIQSGRLLLEKIEINRKPVPDDLVKKFNQTIPAIVAAKPDLTIPFPLGDDLKNLRISD